MKSSFARKTITLIALSLALILLRSALVRAQQQDDPDVIKSSTETPPPELMSYRFKETPGQPFQVTWKDGREATLMLDRRQPAWLSLGFKVTRNTCSPGQLPTGCTFKIQALYQNLELHWSSYPGADGKPDASKISKLVMPVPTPPSSGTTSTDTDYSSDSDPDPILQSENVYPLTPGDPKIPGLTLANLQIECPDWKWLPAQPNLKISYWNTQAMEQNDETLVNGNRIKTVAKGLPLKFIAGSFTAGSATGKSKLEIGKPDKFMNGAYTGMFFIESTSLWVFSNGGKRCEIELTDNFDDVVSSYEDLRSPENRVFKPYVFQSDGSMTSSDWKDLKAKFYSNISIDENDTTDADGKTIKSNIYKFKETKLQ